MKEKLLTTFLFFSLLTMNVFSLQAQSDCNVTALSCGPNCIAYDGTTCECLPKGCNRNISTTSSGSSSGENCIICDTQYPFCSPYEVLIPQTCTKCAHCVPEPSNCPNINAEVCTRKCIGYDGSTCKCLPLGCDNGSSSTPIGTPLKALSIDITNGPNLPSLIESPLVFDEFVGRIGFGLVGSNPSYEFKLPEKDIDLKVNSVSLKDSQGTFYKNIPFSITKLNNTEEKKAILTLRLPNNVSPGTSKLTLNLTSGTSLEGVLYFLETKNIKTPNGEIYGKPKVSSLSINQNNQKVSLKIKGHDFVPNNILYEANNILLYIENQEEDPFTTVNVLPSSLGVQVTKRTVSSKGNTLKINLSLDKKENNETKPILIISTPRGTVSKTFVLK